MTPPQAPPFEKHYPSSVENLRGALTELYLAVGADPEQPQRVSRRFGIHRNLAWKLTRVMRATGTSGVLQYLPGTQGIERAIAAFRDAGAPQERLEAVALAQRDFDAMVELHAGDRSTLELMLDSLGLEGSDDPLEVSRSLAFRGNSGIWGIQAKTRLRTVFLAPNPDRPDQLDLVHVTGLIDLRRLRPDVSWPLFHRQHYNDDGSPRDVHYEPVEVQPGDPTDAMSWTEFCSDPLPEVRVIPTRLGSRYELTGDTIGNRGLTTYVQATVTRSFAPRYRDAENTRGELSAEINAPTENLLFDLILHREIAAEIEPQVLVLQGGSSEPGRTEDANRIPCDETLRRLQSIPPRISTPLFPRYTELCDRVYKRMDWNPEDFRAVRFEMKCPPLHSLVLLRYDLPERP